MDMNDICMPLNLTNIPYSTKCTMSLMENYLGFHIRIKIKHRQISNFIQIKTDHLLEILFDLNTPRYM